MLQMRRSIRTRRAGSIIPRPEVRIHELHTHSFRDPLTGLPNRLSFEACLDRETAQSARSGRHVAVLRVAVEHVVHLDVAYGRDAGPAILLPLAQSLGSTLRPGDTLARFGVNEFAVICPDLVERTQAFAITDRLRAAASAAIRYAGDLVTVGLRITVSFAGDQLASAQAMR